MGLFGRACSGGVVALAMMVACGGSSSRQDRPASRASDEPASIPAHLSVFAGVGSRGFGGDDAPALDAMLDGPRGIAVAADGAVYIADTGNNRVRKVRDGVISTVLGHEAAGPNLLDNASGELSIGPSADSWSERLGSWRTDSSACASCPQAVDGNFIFMPDWEYASAG